ncbi:MAG: hypothetical protein HQK89_00270 [Nitrospirae bacterium]|nr:hypothetical protein [Nitrospirota bacterium]
MKKIFLVSCLSICLLSFSIVSMAATADSSQKGTRKIKLPFVGEKSFNFYEGSSTNYTIKIKKNGDTTIKLFGAMIEPGKPPAAKIIYKGKYAEVMKVDDGFVQIKGNKIIFLDIHGNPEFGCRGQETDPCESELY